MRLRELTEQNRRQLLFRVTIPMSMPSITICTFLTLTNPFKLFDQNPRWRQASRRSLTEMLSQYFNTFYSRTAGRASGRPSAVVSFFILVALLAFFQCSSGSCIPSGDSRLQFCHFCVSSRASAAFCCQSGS